MYVDAQSKTLGEHMDHMMRRLNGVFSCIHCPNDPNRQSYASRESLWKHCLENHSRLFPTRSDELLRYREAYEQECLIQAPIDDTKPVHNVHNGPVPEESIYASSSPSGPALSPRRQSLPSAPEFNESLNPTEQIKLYGGIAKNGRPAELVRVMSDGTAVSLATGKQIKKESIEDDEKKLVLSEKLEDDEAIMRSMARRKRLAAAEMDIVSKKCSEPGCNKEFKRSLDLTRHENTHSRPWKCQEPLCKYHEYGWLTEKELDRHINDKHSASPPLFKCQFPPCSYQSKRESNCKFHMEKSHNWVYVRSKGNGKNRDQAPAQQQNPLPTPEATTIRIHHAASTYSGTDTAPTGRYGRANGRVYSVTRNGVQVINHMQRRSDPAEPRSTPDSGRVYSGNRNVVQVINRKQRKGDPVESRYAPDSEAQLSSPDEMNWLPKAYRPQHVRTDNKGDDTVMQQFMERVRRAAQCEDAKASDAEGTDPEAAKPKGEIKVTEEKKADTSEGDAAAAAAKARKDAEDELERQIIEMEEAEEAREKSEAEVLADDAASDTDGPTFSHFQLYGFPLDADLSPEISSGRPGSYDDGPFHSLTTEEKWRMWVDYKNSRIYLGLQPELLNLGHEKLEAPKADNRENAVIEATQFEESNPHSARAIWSQHKLARTHLWVGQMEKGIELLEHFVKIKEEVFPVTHCERLGSQHELARAYLANGQVEKATELLEHVVKIRQALPPTHSDRDESERDLIRAYRSNGQVAKAEELFENMVNYRKVALATARPNQLPPAPLASDELATKFPTRTWRSSSRRKGGDRLQLRENPYASPLNTKPRENRRKVLRVQLNNQDHLACPDSGSQHNIISKACAIEHGFRIRRKPKDKKQFEVGNGDIVRSIGRVSAAVQLPGSRLWQKKRQFYVLENCPVPLVMGMKFLREADILTKYMHLLENCPAEMSNISSLLWIGGLRNRLRCTIDGRQLEATADTGSDLNLMSLACAEREGFRIDRRVEARSQIVVGNGKVIETLGQVYVSNITLDWREPEAEPPEQSPPTPRTDVSLKFNPRGGAHLSHGEGDDDLYTPFHVVENLLCDIVFGQTFLHDRDAFNKCPELLDIHPTKQRRQFEKHKEQFEFMIFQSTRSILSSMSFRKKPKPAVDLREQHESNWYAELHRRSRNTEEKIKLLPPDKQDAARMAERKKLRDWNNAHDNCRFCPGGLTT